MDIGELILGNYEMIVTVASAVLAWIFARLNAGARRALVVVADVIERTNSRLVKQGVAAREELEDDVAQEAIQDAVRTVSTEKAERPLLVRIGTGVARAVLPRAVRRIF